MWTSSGKGIQLRMEPGVVAIAQHVSNGVLVALHRQLIYTRFEKSLYDLIRGLRNHKGNEKEYIQNSLKECRAEIRGKDMGE